MGSIGCSEISVRNCKYSLRNNPEERSSQMAIFIPDQLYYKGIHTNIH